MPAKSKKLSDSYLKAYQSISYELRLSSYFLSDGWEVFKPEIDHGSKTDILVGEGNRFYRIQVKTIDSHDESVIVENLLQGSDVNYVVYFSKKAYKNLHPYL